MTTLICAHSDPPTTLKRHDNLTAGGCSGMGGDGWGGNSVTAPTHVCKRGGADTATKSLHASTIKIKLMGPDRSKSACTAAVLSGAGRSVCSIVNWRKDSFSSVHAENEDLTDERRLGGKMRRYGPALDTFLSAPRGARRAASAAVSAVRLHQPRLMGNNSWKCYWRDTPRCNQGASFSILNIPSSPSPTMALKKE